MTVLSAPQGIHRFDRSRRLRLKREFAEVKAAGAAFRGQFCMLLALAKPGESTKVGFVTSRRGVGGAVQRNRARRRLREIVRLRWPRVPEEGYWMALIAFRSTLTAAHQDLANDVEHLLAAAGALAPIELEERP
jgi:ribonuclease P protein component